MRASILRPLISLTMTAAVLLLAAACQDGNVSSGKPQYKSESYFIFDTIVTVKVYDDRVAESHFEDIRKLMESVDAEMSRTKETSDISLVNANAGSEAVQVSESTFALLEQALRYADLTDGAFDPTVGPLVDLWGIGNEGAEVPEADAISAAVSLIDFRKVELDAANRTVRLADAGMGLDLGAIAKGYAGDLIREYLSENGFTSAIIDLGGNIVAVGSKSMDAPWTIGIQSPDSARGESIGHVPIRNQSVVSSGVYERFFIEDGVRYHHILSTEDGYPVRNGLDSVTIITDRSADADALSTGIFALGPERGRELVERLDHTEAVFITSEKKVFVTSGLRDRLVMTNGEYTLVRD